MNSKFKCSSLLVLIPLCMVLTMVVTPSFAVNTVNASHEKGIPMLELFMVDAPIEGNMASHAASNIYGSTLPSSWNEAIPDFSSFLPNSTFLQIWQNSDEFSLASVPPVVLLLSAGLVGFICIARRSLFTK